MTELVGQTLDRYKIVSLIGAGGMGSVYRARDTRLKRDVAIKVLPDVADENSHRLERFNREIRTVASLSHPNIVKIHDFGHADGFSYSVMELLRGKNLRDRMRGRPLPVDKALDIGIAVANGLGAAHHQGILHRDIKPENIFVTSSGEIKVLDFGLARTVESVSADDETRSVSDSLTTPGTIVGTTGYMSPEQVRGKELDPRSDIFSLGCVMYEMLSGLHPFRRETRVDTMSAILEHDPPSLSGIQPALPPALHLIVDRCLKKDADDRFESARDVAFAMQALSESRSSSHEAYEKPVSISRKAVRWATIGVLTLLVAAALFIGGKQLLPPPLPENLRLVVVPFQAEGDDPDLEILAAGLTETITDNLGVLENLDIGIDWVVPRHALRETEGQSLEAYRRRFNNTVSIAGMLERDGPNVRLTLEAIDPASGKRLRRSVIEDLPGNVQSFQQMPVLQLAEMLAIDVDTDSRDRFADSGTTMMGAWDVYVRARRLLSSSDGGLDVEEAILLLTEAVELDPLFTNGHVELARACIAKFEETKDDEWIARGLKHAHQASRLEGWADEALHVIGSLHSAAGRHRDSVAALITATNMQPGNAEAFLDLGFAHQMLGQFEEAGEAFDSAIYLRQGYWPGYDAMAKLYLAQGRYEAAAIQFRHIVESTPDFALGYVKVAAANMYMDRMDAATEQLETSLTIEPTFSAYSNLGTLYFQASRFSDAASMFELALDYDPENHTLWGNLAVAYMFGDQPDKAAPTFRRAANLAEAKRSLDPDNPWVSLPLAGYYAKLGERSRGLEILEPVIAAQPSDPRLVGWIAETLEDLDDRERALEWVGRAFTVGIEPKRFEGRPTLRNLVADERYQALVMNHGDTS